MCDTVCVRHDGRTLFAKSSDRPIGEVQLVEWHARRAADPSGTLRTQYLTIDDTDAFAVLGSRPAWLWGFEHGVNEHRVAIGNQRVFTVDDAASAPAALIGMDLVRLGLERARTANEAVDVMTSLLERYGQGGVADATNDIPYFSSFVVADPRSAWVVETSGRTWAAQPVHEGAAVSNRLAMDAQWTRASSDVRPGHAFDEWRDPAAFAAAADIRLACTRPAVTGAARVDDPADLAALLRHHGGHAWGRPGDDPAIVDPLPPAKVERSGRGFSVCMHVRGHDVTAASMICELADDPDQPLRAWVAVGSPCVSVYVPVFPGVAVPAALADERTWLRFDALRRRVEADPDSLPHVRAVLAPVEAELWVRADEVVERPHDQPAAVAEGLRLVEAGLRELDLPG